LNLNLRKPCANCPFLRDGAINLAPGRLASIIDDLAADDGINFQCHKTIHSARGGDWEEDGNGNQQYHPSGNESVCVGAAIYMLKIGRPSVSMRFALIAGMITLDELTAQNNKIIEPPACGSYRVSLLALLVDHGPIRGTAQVGYALWPDRTMQPQGAAVAVGGILRRLRTKGFIASVPDSILSRYEVTNNGRAALAAELQDAVDSRQMTLLD
jgi:hypothetical protein